MTAITTISIEDFADIWAEDVEQTSPRLVGPHHMQGMATVWTTTPDAIGPAKVYVVSGEEVAVITG